MVNNKIEIEELTVTERLKAILTNESPEHRRGDNLFLEIEEETKNVIIRNIYSRRLEDLTFNDLNMLGYTNPNLFVREWTTKYGSFDKDKIVWVIVYVEERKK